MAMRINTRYGESDQTLVLLVDEASDTVTYLGYAAPGALVTEARWRIIRILLSGNVREVRWADGDDKFDNIWSDRAGLTYL